MNTKISIPKRGEMWLVDFDPTVEAEMKKKRPAVVINTDNVGRLPLRLIAPITDWKPYFINDIWQVRIEPDSTNGLTKVSSVDTLQVRGIDTQRFIHPIGKVSDSKMEEIILAIGIIIEHP